MLYMGCIKIKLLFFKRAQKSLSIFSWIRLDTENYSFKQLHIYKGEVLTNHMISVRKSCVNFLYY